MPVIIGALIGALVVSLVACSFPSLSKKYESIKLPSFVFFLGKHFGTGVIIATAFVHLLQDAFKSLNGPDIPDVWKGSTGRIVMVSLLLIFLIEYISTTYVERVESAHEAHPHWPWHAHDVLPADNYHDEPEEISPAQPENNTHHTIHDVRDLFHHQRQEADQREPIVSRVSEIVEDAEQRIVANGMERLLHHHHHSDSSSSSSSSSEGDDHQRAHLFFEGHHRHERRGSHGHGHFPSGRRKTGHSIKSDLSPLKKVVGILVLQTGIMLHSLVIGATLALTTGSDFTSLLTALLFHQLFEGLSLGLRIANLPSSYSRLRIILCVLFAITTPIGIIVGIVAIPRGANEVASQLARGIMASVSAGMLIYASSVEMLAGDFVMDRGIKIASLRKQTAALLSVLAGAVAMSIVGL